MYLNRIILYLCTIIIILVDCILYERPLIRLTMQCAKKLGIGIRARPHETMLFTVLLMSHNIIISRNLGRASKRLQYYSVFEK